MNSRRWNGYWNLSCRRDKQKRAAGKAEGTDLFRTERARLVPDAVEHRTDAVHILNRNQLVVVTV